MAETDRRAIVALALGILGLFSAGLLGVGSLAGAVLATTVLLRPTRDNDVAWAALVANVFALLTVLPLAGALFAYQSVQHPGAVVDSRPIAPDPAPDFVPEGAPASNPGPDLPPPVPAAPEAGTPASSDPLRVSDGIDPPRKTYHVNPVYPEAARKAQVEGVVILECTISPAGEVVEVKVLRSVPGLDQAAIDAVEQWRYTPTLLNGVPVPVIMTVTVNFKLG